MKKIFFVFLISYFIFPNAYGSSASLSGKVSDKESGKPLPGAVIYLPDLKTGAVTGSDGSYKINNLPEAKVLVQVNLVGYEAFVGQIDLATVTTFDFQLGAAIKEIHQVIVTGASQSEEKDRTPVPVTIVPKTALLQNASSNIIDALASQPGLSQVSTGPAISKPVIRGLGFNRVVVVNDGIRQEGQQWGDEHGIEVDEFGVNRVEILKGPASLAYGSDAMAGVINIISAPPLPEGSVNANLIGNYQTNNGLIGYSGNITGNNKGFIWDLRFSSQQAHCYKNRYDGYVYGTAFHGGAYNAVLGLNKSWGYSHLHLSAFGVEPSIAEGERDSATGKFTMPYYPNGPVATDSIVPLEEMLSYRPRSPYQYIEHYKAALNSNVVIGNGNLKTIFGLQRNHREEHGNDFMPPGKELTMVLHTLTYDVRYIFPEKNGRYLSLGVNGMKQSSENKGVEYLIPDYGLFDIGGFFTAKKSWEKLDLSGGLRCDTRSLKAEELITDTTGKRSTTSDPFHIKRFDAFSRGFSSISGSLGMAYQFSEHFFSKLNVSRGFRAPNIAELASRGEHEGSGRYVYGEAQLNPETSLQIDFALGINTEHLSAEADLFYNGISNYIFMEKLRGANGGDSIVDPSAPIASFKYIQEEAALFGGELLVDIHPHPLHWLHFENSFSYVQAEQKDASDSTKYLPLIPAARFASEIRADIKKAGKFMSNTYLKAGISYHLKQDKVYSAFDTETETPSYLLLNIGLGTELVKGDRTLCYLFLSINNLTDAGYQDHLNRLKYAPENYASGRKGIYNMGRNISFKLLIPFQLRRPKE